MSIEKAYNIWADQYDHNDNKTRDLDQVSTRQTLEKYAFKKVLELGCGTGKNTSTLLEKAEEVTGLDFSEEMLSKAKAKIDDARVTFMQADMTQALQVQDNYYDLITCSLVLEHIRDLGHVFAEVHKKLIAGGLFFISELHPFKQYLGTKARYETEDGVQELEVYVHHISEFITEAEKNGFKMLEIQEWFDEHPDKNIPRLISFVFKNSLPYTLLKSV